jgi:PHP family Zn ribbon phosphoesterase
MKDLMHNYNITPLRTNGIMVDQKLHLSITLSLANGKYRNSMKYVDLHIHSPYSRGTSAHITPEAILSECRQKGVDIVGTGDIFVREWKQKWELYIDSPDIEVLPTTEICSVDRNKQCHVLLVMTWDDVEKVRVQLEDWSDSQGKPNIYLNLHDLKDAVKSVSDTVLFIPAHCFTPWYGIMGYRYSWTPEQVVELKPDALETGLSASREMIWSISCLQSIPLVSFSDAHSTSKIGREVTMIPNTLTFHQAIVRESYWTLEHPPELGKYYLNGHRDCNTSSDTDTVCPVCGKQYTIGTKYTVSKYRDTASPLKDTYIIPLSDILRKVKVDIQTTKELDILSGMEITDNDYLNQLLDRIRRKNISFKEGYDGKYGRFKM